MEITILNRTGKYRAIQRLALLLLLLLPGRATAEPAQEYSVKAAIILNFARYTQWPAPPAAGTPLTLCVLGNGFLKEVFASIHGKEVNGRPLRVRHAAAPEGISPCDILFVPRDFDRRTLTDLLRRLRRSPVLTIGESPGFIAAGGMINLFQRDNRIRFEVNPGAVQDHGLMISSRLLKLAIIVENPTTGQEP